MNPVIISDASWGILISLTTYKAEEAGGIVELVNPRNTSKQCSVCGGIQSMPLSQRTYQCPDCGVVIGRDHNAAINIKKPICTGGLPGINACGERLYEQLL
jgi:putative transposase